MKRIMLVFVIVAALVFIGITDSKAANPAQGMVSITIDDGYKSLLYAATILQQYGMVATAFVPTKYVSYYSDRVTWTDLRSLRLLGWEIGNHTRSHPCLVNRVANGFPSEFTDAQIMAEINGAQTDFVNHGFIDVRAFAFPLGETNARLQSLLTKTIYLTSGREAWVEDTAGDSASTVIPWNLRAMGVKNSTTLAEIQNALMPAQMGQNWPKFVFHDIVDIPKNNDQVSKAMFVAIVQYIAYLRDQGSIKVVTISEGLEELMLYKRIP